MNCLRLVKKSLSRQFTNVHYFDKIFSGSQMNRMLRLPNLRRFAEFTAIDGLNLPIKAQNWRKL
jgi:hypothetical protein